VLERLKSLRLKKVKIGSVVIDEAKTRSDSRTSENIGVVKSYLVARLRKSTSKIIGCVRMVCFADVVIKFNLFSKK
jgi:hypothetical protein